MCNDSHITIRRDKSYADRLRAYKVKVDGVAAGAVRAGESVAIPVAPGGHKLQLWIDWCGSVELQFDAQPGQNIVFKCGSGLTRWRILLVIVYVLFRTRQYLWLRRVT